MNKQGKIKLIIGIVLVSLVILSGIFSLDTQVETTEHGRKIVSNLGVEISAKEVETCEWKPDTTNDGYKICEAIIYGHNPNNYELTVDKPGEFANYFNLDKDAIVKNKKYFYYYSNQYEEYVETVLDETCFMECYNTLKTSGESKYLMDIEGCRTNCSLGIPRKRFYNWLPLAKDIKDTPTNSDEFFAYKVVFEFPQYEKARYDFSIHYKKADSTDIPILLDPDVSACGTLSTANSEYTLTKDINTTGTCFTISEANITLNCQNYEINYSSDGGDFGYGILSDQVNTTIKNCKIVEGVLTGRWDFAIYFNNATNGTIRENNISTSGEQSHNIYMRNVINISIINNTLFASGDNGRGVMIIHSNYTQITNNSINTTNTGGYGVGLGNGRNATIKDNIIDTSGGAGNGIYLYSSSKYNHVSGNDITTPGDHSQAISITESSFNTISNNTAIGGYYGVIQLEQSDSNNIVGNTLTTTSVDYRDGIYITDSHSNTFSNNTVTTLKDSSNGIQTSQSSNNTFSNMNVYTSGIDSFAMYIYGFASTGDNFTMSDSILNCSLTKEIYIRDSVRNGVWNFTNVTREKGEHIEINWSSNGTGVLNMHWYLYVNVTDNSTQSALVDANVSIYNTTKDIIYSELTSVTGTIKKTLLEYTNINNTKITYFTPHTINISKLGYTTNSTIYNLTIEENVYHNINLSYTGIRYFANLSQSFTTSTLTDRLLSLIKSIPQSFNINFLLSRIQSLTKGIIQSFSIGSLTERIRTAPRNIFQSIILMRKDRTYDFSGVFNSQAFNHTVLTEPPLSKSPAGETEFTSYTEIASSDDTYVVSTNESGHPYHKFEMEINEPTINYIDVTWEGSGSGNISLWVWDYTLTDWSLLDSGSGATDFTLSARVSNLNDVRGGTGNITFLVQD